MLPRLLVVTLAFAASAAFAQKSVILVRHAELADANGVEAKAVPLSPAGQARAEQLSKMLERSGVSAVYATDFLRTRATAEPSARLLGREVTVTSQGDAREFVERLRKEHANDVVLVVGHSDTVPGLVKALGVSDDVKIERADFGNVFIVTPQAGAAPAFLRLRY
jgi:broad specificity phosphatase PhoE